LDVIDHDYPAAHIRLIPYLCALTAGDPRPIACQRVEWVDPPLLRSYRFPPANERLIEQVIARLTPTRVPTTAP
jgi:hypothetical protein